MIPLYLGVDGGGTKTEFLVADAQGRIAGRAGGGTSYHLEIGMDAAIGTIGEGISAACREAGIAPHDLAHAFFGLPAYGEDAAADARLREACGRLLGHDRYACGNDMVCGWAGSLACEDGINIVAGTGSIGYGERQGIAARVGGWGEIIGDEGSAYWIARRGLDAFARMSDGRLPHGPLHAMIADSLDLAADLELCERIMGPRALTRGEVAGLAPLVSAAASAGDTAAAAILADAAAELVGLAVALRHRLGFPDDERTLVSWSGGVLQNVATVRDAFVAGLRRTTVFEQIVPRHTPASGAVLYAIAIAARGHPKMIDGRSD